MVPYKAPSLGPLIGKSYKNWNSSAIEMCERFMSCAAVAEDTVVLLSDCDGKANNALLSKKLDKFRSFVTKSHFCEQE